MATPLAPAIEIAHLTKHYGAVRAVDGLDLSVERGEVFCLLGPNGAGKTTTTEILEGYRQRDGGRVRVLGTDPWRAGIEWRARLGIVPQTSREQPELTVRELVGHFASLYPRSRPVDDVMEQVGLAEKARARIRTLSGGQRRRLDVALGIVGDPELLFLDEPTTGFDPAARRAFWSLVRSLAAGGTTILLTTHYLQEAAALASRVAVVADGRLVATGPPDELGGARRHVTTVQWQEGGTVRAERTTHPTSLVTALAARLVPDGGEVPGLQVLRPSLEDVYLQLLAEAAGRNETDTMTGRAPDATSSTYGIAAAHPVTEARPR